MQVEAEVRAEITRLGNVLSHLNDVLSVDIGSGLNNATMNLNSTLFKIQTAEELLAEIKTDAVRTQLLLQGTVQLSETNFVVLSRCSAAWSRNARLIHLSS